MLVLAGWYDPAFPHGLSGPPDGFWRRFRPQASSLTVRSCVSFHAAASIYSVIKEPLLAPLYLFSPHGPHTTFNGPSWPS